MAFRALALSLSMVALVLSGCSQGDRAEQQGASTGSASAYVKDAPSDDFREVHVLVTEVAVHRSGSGGPASTSGTATGVSTTVGNVTLSASATATASANTTSDDGPDGPDGTDGEWFVVFSDASGIDVDLLNTTGARAAFLGESDDLEPGNYQQIRMEVYQAYGIDHDGERVDIEVSSGSLRSVKGFTIAEGMETRLTIDIDLEKSLRQTGNGQWRMTPVIGKTTAATVEDGSSGVETANPGDVETVPEAGDGTTPSVSATASASATTSSTNSTSTGA